jgi:anhydro-N-acetylmuramic acid kinase
MHRKTPVGKQPLSISMRAIGLMSGTSLDGIDIALMETDGADRVRRICGLTDPYPDDFKARLQGALRDAVGLTDRHGRPGSLAAVEQELTQRHATALMRFMGNLTLQPSSVDLVGFHGQTVLHRPSFGPARGLTVQLGNGELLSQLTGIDVVYDLRAGDVAAGGQGAPLVPVYHRALAASLPQRPVAFVNIGGVANVTWIGANGHMVAFDTGPGNAMIDDWMAAKAGLGCDTDGATAARGRVHEDYVSEYLRNSHFAAPAPKSLDRNAFPVELVDPLSIEDGAATLTAFTVAAIARSREHMPAEPLLWVVSGGGRRNKTLMSMLAGLVENAVVPAEAVGLDGDSMEAEAWAYLAVRSYRGYPLTYPGTTGVDKPTRGGVLVRAGA